MRILLDNNLDWRFGRGFGSHEVAHVLDLGWAELKNGELVKKASGRFDVLVTVDKNMRHQTSLHDFDLAVVILDARTNRLSDTLPFVSDLEALLPKLQPGQFYVIERS